MANPRQRSTRHRICALLLLLTALILAIGPRTLYAQSESMAATFVAPENLGTIDTSQTIRWTSRPDALAYYLYVGSAPGLKDIINTGEIQSTEWPAIRLPAGATVYARIHTKYAEGWVNSSIEFTVSPIATFSNSTPEATISPIHTFEWSSVMNAEAYYLYVGSSPGLRDYVNTGETLATSFHAVGLPAGRTVHARLHTKHGGIWRYLDLDVYVAPVATFTNVVNKAQDVDPAVTLRWSEVEGAQAYYLYIGTYPGMKDLLNSGETQATQWPATFLPTGETLYARLHTKHGGVWRYTDVEFQKADYAVFIEPTIDGEEIDPRAPLVWTEVPAAEAYYLYVGSAPGTKDIMDTGEITDLSFDIMSLPRGTTLYATLHTKAGGRWRSTQRSFRVSPIATLVNRPDFSSGLDTRAPLEWTTVEGAEAYYLYAGTTPGSKDLINSGELQVTQYPISGLPPGQSVHVRLYTKHEGNWRYADYTVNTRAVAYLEGAVATTGIWQPATPLTWSPISDADRYYVYVGTAPGALDLSSSGEISAAEFTMPAHHASAISSDRTVYIRLHSRVNGRWYYVDYVVNFLVAAQLSFPKNGSANVDVTALRMTWNDVESASRYRIQMGTAPGIDDVMSVVDVEGLEIRTGALPGGQPIYVRLWTDVAGEWRYSDSLFSTRPASTLLQPRHGELGIDPGRRIEWTTVAGADLYMLELGTSPGGSELLHTGAISDTSAPAPDSLTSTSGLVYARVWTRHDGTWRFSDSIFSTSNEVLQPKMVWASNSNAFLARDAFRWTASPMAESYRLKIGSAPGSGDVHDTGPLRTVRRLVTDLPEDMPLFGSLETTMIDGSRFSEDFDLNVQDADIAFEDRWNLAIWATAEVRSMAKVGNTPLPNTLLLDAVRAHLRETAFCTSYALAEVELLRQSNIGLGVRILDACLNTNRYDCHTLIEVLNPESGSWLILDPTFGIAARRTSDGEWITALEIFEATRDGIFDAVEYVPLTDEGMAFASSYYLDYPLLFANVYAPGTASLVASVDSVLPYYELTGLQAINEWGRYAIRCTEGDNGTRIMLNGAESDVFCDGDFEGLSYVFEASSIAPLPDSPAYEIATPRRFVF